MKYNFIFVFLFFLLLLLRLLLFFLRLFFLPYLFLFFLSLLTFVIVGSIKRDHQIMTIIARQIPMTKNMNDK